LDVGKYVIICSTFKPGQESEFILRLFSERENKSGRLDNSTVYNPVRHSKKDDDEASQAQRSALRNAFEQIAGDDLEIDAYELGSVLNAAFKGDGFEFSDEACRSLVAIMDTDHSGKLGFEEFNELWSDLKIWKSAFKKYDADRSGTFDTHELRPCLADVGFTLSNQTYWSICMRYARKNMIITFDDYILMVARLKTIFDTYRAMDHTQQNGGNVTFNQEEFIKTVIYT